jgi:hypothetical protein
MAVHSVTIALQTSRKDGKGVTAQEFLAPLNIESGEIESAYADGGLWTSGMIYFAVVQYSDFAHVDRSSDAGAQSEAFFSAAGEAFRSAARFLERRPPQVTAQFRTAGLNCRLFVEVRMDQDQMELEFPPEFMVACARHGLGVISNDF